MDEEARERRAEARSIAHLLAPSSIAVVGASRRRDAVGNAVLRSLVAGEFTGALYPVNASCDLVEGLEAYPDVASVEQPVDLAVIAVPAAAVVGVLDDCAAKGVRSVVVISSGFAEVGDATSEAALTATARRHGIRLVGPNCFGIANTNPLVRMNATFAPVAPVRGRIGFASQSGGVGIELLSRAHAAGVGVSSFVSLGNKADVSTNDLLQYWDEDPDTDLVVLYVESFGNPRKFGRIARRVTRRKPVLVVKSGRTAAGSRGASSHTAALAAPEVAVDELFRQAGVVRVDTLELLFDTAVLMAHQPLPSGPRVAIVSNGGGPGILAADACAAAGLEVPELSGPLQQALRACAPAGAGVTNPIDLVASAGPDVFETALRAVLASGEVDAVLVIFVAPLVTDPRAVRAAVARAAASAGTVTIAACFLGDGAVDEPLRTTDGGRVVPTYTFPESAAYAMGRAARLTAWRASPAGVVPSFADLDLDRARELVGRVLGAHPGGTWVDAGDVVELLGCAGVTCLPTRSATTPDHAADEAVALGFPVALKAGAPGLVHKSDVGGVVLDLRDAAAVHAACSAMQARLGDDAATVLVQPMASPGVELIAGLTHDPSFGPLVLLGMGGVTAELVHDAVVRLVPLTDLDAASMVRSLRTAPVLFGYRGAPAVDVDAIESVVLRLAQLADAVPEIAELDCNPLVVSADGAVVVDAKLRLTPRPSTSFACR